MDVGEWLRRLGLGQYEAAFRDSEIDADVLPELEDQHLKDLGVSLGHRLKILRAIRELAAGEPAKEHPAPEPPQPAEPASQGSAERRHLTVMFCDLVGSTSISAKLDAEDWRDLVGGYLDAASAAVKEMGGHVAKKLGDGIMALFGYPLAQENDAERAVRASLGIQRALAEINAKNAGSGRPELMARIGVETGAVVVDSSGEIFGDAPNVAARVQALAEPGAIFVTAKVQRQAAGLFVAEDRGAQALKGVPEPTVLYRIVRASGGGRRSGQRALTPLVGREEEVAMLLRRWERARQGEGQFVQIVGEPGLGKSRLIEEFRARLVDTPHTWVEWASSQLLQNTPLHPIAEWGRQRFGGADVPAERRLADLESTLQSINLDPTENVPLLAHLLDIPQPPERASKLAPEELRRRQLAALLAWYMAGARVQPAVVAMEDLHWADPTTLDVLRSFADRGAFAPMLVLATTRPEFRAPWDMRSHHGVISLAPLDRRQVARMVGELAAKHALSQAIVEGVNERTGGVPLFVEEVTRLLLERGELGGSQTIPPTLQQSLSARLDRLGPAREVAMIGAVLGRGFSYPLLKAIATPVAAVADRGPTGLNEAGYRGLDEAGLQAALEKLAEADILLVEGLPPQADYRFKHALIQDAAYENLLKSRRQALHRRAAETLRDQFPDRAATQPEVLAHHFTEAGLTDAAIEYWGKAGDQALRRSAFQEAIAHLGKAIEMADQAGVGKASDVAGQRRLHLHVAHGNALFAARGYGAPEATEAFVKARNSEPGDKDAPERLAVDFGLWVGCYYRGELPQMTAYAGSLLNDVRAKPDSTEAGVAHRVRGITHQFAGEYVEARHHLEKALALFQPGRDDDLAFRFGMDAGVVAMLYLALALWPLGDVDRAVSLIERARERIASVMHIGTHANEKLLAAMFELMRGDHPRAAQNAVDLARLARDRDLNLWRAFGVFLEGWAMAKGGTLGQGLEDMRRGADLLREQNVLLFDGLLKIALAEAETGAGDPEHAIVILDEALATADRTGYRAFEAELHRVRGEILLERDQTNPAPAEEALRTAIDVARRQSARSFELRAALSLAKLYQSIGRPVEAHDILAPALEGFSPTPELAEIAEALGLLGALAETDKVEAAVAQRQRRLHLQTAYGQAMMMSKGFGAEETKAAFARAAELAAKADDFAERFAARHGEWTLAMVRGDQRRARELASAFLKEAEDTGRVIEAGVARRGLALICYSSGDFLEARTHCERALDACDPQRDQETRERFSEDTGTVAMSCLALTTWQLGEVERARELIDEANLRARKLGHGPSMANHLMWKSYLENLRGDAAAALIAAEDSGRLGREHGMQFYCVMAELNAAWAHGRLRDATAGAEELRRALAVWADQGGFGDAWFYQTVLAELEAQTLGADNALARIDEALVLAQQVGARGDLAFPHRLRGEILLKRDPSNPAPAEEAFLTAFAIAQQQGARSWGLRAALSLAKLYQSTARPVEAHDVLAPALEGFSPTPELPEIEEAQALLAKLTEAEEVKAAAASRQRRLQLQTSYSKALMLSRGFGSEEAKAAFTLAWELAKGVDDAAERFDAYYGLFIGSQLRAELRLAREIAEKFLCEAEKEARTIEAAAARRSLGTARLYQGDLAQAHAHFEQTLRIYDPERDREAKFRFGTDVGALAMVYLALTNWLLGEAGQARKLGEEAIARAVESA
ncbi:MAG TPA: AAA family ATPase, partial [Roseiarcus sp.]